MKDNKINGKKTGMQILGEFMKGSYVLFFFSCVFAFFNSLADMLSPQIIRMTVDNVIGGEEGDYGTLVNSLIEAIGGFGYLRQHLWIMAAAVIAVAVFKAANLYGHRVVNTKASETLIKTMRDRLYAHIERLPYSWHMSHRTGDVIQICTTDIDTIRGFISEQLTAVLRITIMVVLSAAFMFSMNVELTLFALIPIPVIFLYSLRFHKKIKKEFRVCDENEGILSAMAQENLTGVRVVRAFGREAYERAKFEKQNFYYASLWERMGAIMSAYWATGDIMSGLQVCLVVVVGVILAIRGELTSGEYIAAITYNMQIVWPIRMLGRVLSELSKADVAMERVAGIMNADEEKTVEGAKKPPMNGDIVFDHVSFSYEGSGEVLHDVSFTMKAGSTLGIIGGTGSGKSTLMLLLDKLYELKPTSGRITIGGVDISEIDTKYLRENIGFVLQEPYLFSATLAENIGITSEKLNMEEIVKASRIAYLDEAVSGFAKGYDTFVGERGVTLSGGQKQRAAIARMLTKNTPIMIFDDSLSAVDTETDSKIRAQLEKIFGTASIVFISQRITTLSKADKILVMDNGRIAEQGTHDELKNAGGIYQKINEIQSGYVEEAENE